MASSKVGNIFSHILQNAGKLIFGSALAGVFGLIYTLLAARTLSPVGFGEVALIFAWPRLVATIGTCRSWQVILHYGAVPLEQGDRASVQRSFSFAFGLDVMTAAGSFLAGILGVLLFSRLLGVGQAHLFYAALLACLVIPGRCLNASATGVLRLFDKMGMVAREEPYTAITRLALALLSWALDWGVAGFVFAYGMAMIVGQAYLIGTSFKILNASGFAFSPEFHLLRLAKQMPAGVWELVLSSNLAKTVISGMIPALTLIIGVFFGPAVVAFFSLADSFISAVGTPADLMEQSYYPELTRLDIRRPEIWKLLLRVEFLSVLMAVAAIAVVWIGGAPVFAFFGKDYVQALPILDYMAPTLLFWLMSMPLEGILYCAGRSKSVLFIQMNYVVFMAGFMSVAIFYHSVEGIGLAYSMANFVNILVYLAILSHIFKNRRTIVPLHERLPQEA